MPAAIRSTGRRHRAARLIAASWRAICALQPGDMLVMWKLDRRSRPLRHLLFTLEAITTAGAGFRSLTEAIDTTTALGRLMTQALGAFRRVRAGDDRRADHEQAGARAQSRPAPNRGPATAPRPSSPVWSAYRVPPCNAYYGSIGSATARYDQNG
jgi:hypothetical protein